MTGVQTCALPISRLADGSLYATDPAGAAALAQRNAEIDDALLQALERWEVLGQ